MGLFTSDATVAGFGRSYLVRVGPAYAFLGLGLALYFAAQGRGRTAQPLLATLTRLLVAGGSGSLGLGVLGWGIDSLFALMACGLVLVRDGDGRGDAPRARVLPAEDGDRCEFSFLGSVSAWPAAPRVPPEAQAAAATTPVTVSHPVEREVTDYADFTGRTAAVDSVEVRARVWGYLDKVNFKEGALVKKGDVLFEIDPRPYQAALNQAKANVASGRGPASSGSTTRTYQRARTADRHRGDRPGGATTRSPATAARSIAPTSRPTRRPSERAKLDLDYTKVTAPVSGRVSRYVVTVGNLVQAGDQSGGTLLTTIVSVDPMYAYFDVDEHTVLRVRQLIREGKADSARDGELPVCAGPGQRGRATPTRGPSTSWTTRSTRRPAPCGCGASSPTRTRRSRPGYFARVRVPIGRPHKALLVTDRALDTDQGQKVVYVVNDKNEVVSRPVRLGALHDGLREITDGLKPGERVIVNGLQQVRPGVTVEPKLVDMPASRVRNRERQRSRPRPRPDP